MGMLILGLGGFGVTHLTGTLRSIGRVGETEIDINDYARALQSEIRAIEAERGEPVSFAQARERGLDRAILAQLVTTAALEEETRRMSVSVGDGNLHAQIVEMQQFQGLDGSFDRDSYRFALEQAGLSEAEFEEDIRAETARTLLQAAVMSGVTTAPTHIETLLNYIAERRDATWAMLGRADLAGGLAVPSEADLKRFHEENAARFTAPETREITYAWLTPEMVIDTVGIDEATLRAAYDERIDEFRRPERRLVERLSFADRPAAEAALGRIGSGEGSFEDLVEARGLALEDVDLGDVSRAELGDAGEAVFAAAAGDIVGPVETSLGPALFRVNAVLRPRETTFEEAREDLRDELAGDRARRMIDARIDRIDDLLAGGATIEDLAAETEMEKGTIGWHEEVRGGIAAYEGFRAAAAEVTEKDYPEVIRLDDGGIFALRLDRVTEPALKPLDQVRDEVRRGWRDAATVAALRARLAGQLPRLRAGTGFAELGMTPQSAEALTRNSFPPDMPPAFVETLFAMEPGEVETIGGGGQLVVLRLDAIRPPPEDSPDVAQLRTALRNQAASGLAQDLFQAVANDIRARAGIEIDQQALNAVHANFQ